MKKKDSDRMFVVSACLAGLNCRYDGKSSPCKKVIDLVRSEKAITVCPEQLGGLPTPRVPSEIRGKKVFGKDGTDFTKEFEKGAKEALKIAKSVSAKNAILKARSPSCGSNKIYDGTFSHTLVKGDGMFVKLCKKKGIEVLTEEEI